MPQDFISRLKRLSRKLESASAPSHSSDEYTLEPEAPPQDAPSTVGADPLRDADSVPAVSGFVQNQIYHGHVSMKEATRGLEQNAKVMVVEVNGVEGRVLVKDRRKWRPRKPITLVFSGKMDGPFPVFGYKPEPFDPR